MNFSRILGGIVCLLAILAFLQDFSLDMLASGLIAAAALLALGDIQSSLKNLCHKANVQLKNNEQIISLLGGEQPIMSGTQEHAEAVPTSYITEKDAHIAKEKQPDGPIKKRKIVSRRVIISIVAIVCLVAFGSCGYYFVTNYLIGPDYRQASNAEICSIIIKVGDNPKVLLDHAGLCLDIRKSDKDIPTVSGNTPFILYYNSKDKRYRIESLMRDNGSLEIVKIEVGDHVYKNN